MTELDANTRAVLAMKDALETKGDIYGLHPRTEKLILDAMKGLEAQAGEMKPKMQPLNVTQEDRRRAVYMFFEAAVRGWKDEPANRYADLDWNEVIYRTATTYADAMLKAR